MLLQGVRDDNTRVWRQEESAYTAYTWHVDVNILKSL